MLDVPGQPILDKQFLIGSCRRLPLSIDAQALRHEVSLLPADVWGTRGGRVGVHNVAEALFLRGFAPAEGDRPVEDRPALDALPYVRSVIHGLIAAPPLRCLLARLPAGAVVAPHIDRAPYFSKTLRIHVPVETNEAVYMAASGLSFTMREGEVWALNNSALHGVWNAHSSLPRTHLICDFLPSASLLDLLERGDGNLGVRRADVEAHIGNARAFSQAANG